MAVASKAPLLLMGPTGSGKSLLARRIYELKKSRRQVAGPFVEVNCATIRGDGAMSALFGHVKGSFTGAVQSRPGLLRAADGGVLLLDEIGELGVDEQAMLLRALEDKTFLPLGSDKEVSSNFQLIAGTNRDLAKEVATGGFREDLFARINLWTFRLPPLRQRTEDIEPNVRYELDQFARRENTNITFNKEARDRFLAFAKSPAALWTGNFRDLSGSLQRMATLTGGSGGGGGSHHSGFGRAGDPAPPVTLAACRLTHYRLRRRFSCWSGSCLSARSRNSTALIGCNWRMSSWVCRESSTLSEAGRTLFAASRRDKKTPNDADRLRKYLATVWPVVAGPQGFGMIRFHLRLSHTLYS